MVVFLGCMAVAVVCLLGSDLLTIRQWRRGQAPARPNFVVFMTVFHVVWLLTLVLTIVLEFT